MIPSDPREGVDEQRLIQEILGGNPEAFEYFVRQYQRKVYRMAMRLLRDAGEADCVTQESFIKAYQALAEFRGRSSFETWITRIAINTCHDRLKRHRWISYFHQVTSRADRGGDAPHKTVVSAEPSPERRAFSREVRERLREAIKVLSPRQRSVFLMKHFEELSIPEIAEATGLDSGTIKSHLFRAASKIRARLKDFRKR